MASGRSLELRMIQPSVPKMFKAVPHNRTENRHERRRAEAMVGKKNTRGFPIGFNKLTWSKYNTEEKAVSK